MTRFEIISVVMGGVQVLVAAGGFWAVFKTLRVLVDQTALLRNSIAAGANASVGDRQLEADRVFVEHPDLRKYFLENVEVLPDSPDHAAAASVAQLLANYFDTYFLQSRSYPQLYEEAAWLAYVETHISGSPILRAFIGEHSSWFTDDLVQLARSRSSAAPAQSGQVTAQQRAGAGGAGSAA